MIIRNHDDWVRELMINWPRLQALVEKFIDTKKSVKTIPQLTTQKEETIGKDIERAVREGDFRRLRLYLQETWWRAPDDPSIHDIPDWDVLCELLAEDWAIDPRE